MSNDEVLDRTSHCRQEAHRKPRDGIYYTLQFDWSVMFLKTKAKKKQYANTLRGHRDKQQKHTQQSLAVSAAAKHSTFFTRQANTNEAHWRQQVRFRVFNRMVANRRGSFLEMSFVVRHDP